MPIDLAEARRRLQEQQARGVSVRELARRMGAETKHRQLNNFLNGVVALPRVLAPVVLAYAASLSGDEDRVSQDSADSGVEASTSPPAAWSRAARVFEQELLLEAAKQGLDDEELAAIRRALRDIATAGVDAGGRPRLLSDAEQMQELEAVALGLRAWIGVRAKRRRQG